MATIGSSKAAEPSITARRRLLAAQNIPLDGIAPGQLGLAFSGGGIRSATISLGIAQALARKDRLLDFDYMSTVSGGGYFGSFLRSLFLPQAARGSDARPGQAVATPADTQFALAVLKSEPNSTTIGTGADAMTNPIRWLRENSRYLAPAGPTDFAVAATYIIRNWVTMLCVFALPTLLFFMAAHGLVHGLAPGNFADAGSWTPPLWRFSLSILIVPPALLLILSVLFGIANWLTVFTVDRRLLARAFGKTVTPAERVLFSAGAALLAGMILLIFGLHYRSGVAPCLADGFTFCGDRSASLLAALSTVLGAATIVAALIAIGGTGLIDTTEPKIGSALFGNELRRVLTAINARINVVMILLLALAIVDTVALALETDPGRWTKLAIASLLAPLGRWLIQKLQASFGASTPGGGFGAFLARYMWQLAFVVAVLLWGGLAMLLDLLVRTVAYAPDGQWLPAYAVSFAILVVLLFVTGVSVSFINLSSLHSLYAARLTRTFLGASNQDRLRQPTLRSITGYQTNDVIKAEVYQQQVCAAPLHLMNVTLNETISATGSQLLERDRKGIPLVIAPEGIWIDAAEAGSTKPDCAWDNFDTTGADPLTIGQITAISGAAASSAMGSRTTLGGALLFTYANIRLGYWWNRGNIGNIAPPRTIDWLRWTGTFGYLLREMTARYRSTTSRINLSDGGHLEDSGVYELLRRQISTIVYCDNGEDAEYHFEDLEILVRKARLDIGVSIEAADPDEVLRALGVGGARIFLNGQVGDWRLRARSREHTDPAFALLLLVRDAGGDRIGTIVLLKPSLFGSLPADVWGYAEAHPSFPHESTANQFFTEAQWESYRKLGVSMMQHLLTASPDKADVFRNLPATATRSSGAAVASIGRKTMTIDVAGLLAKSQAELDALFTSSPAGSIPDGEAKGTAIIAPGTVFSAEIATAVNIFAWQGKEFDATHGFLRNHILPFGLKAIVAKVYEGTSWFDDKPCIVLDYSETSILASRIRDEIRQIGANVYLGNVYWDKKRLFDFALEFGG